jgi:hypothetical protein
VTLPSTAVLTIDLYEILVTIALLILFFEIFKSTFTTTSSIIEHILSTIVFVIFFTELLNVKMLETPEFMLVTIMAFIDVITGFTVGIAAARRDFGINR